MQGTFIGVLMSATLPARLGEPSRALIVARRLGPRARDAAGGARHDGLPDAAQPARARDPRGRRRSRASACSTATTARCCSSRSRRSPRCSPSRSRPCSSRRPRCRARARAAGAAAAACAARWLRLRDGLRVFRQPAPRAARHGRPARRLGAAVARLLAAADGARPRRPRRRSAPPRRAVRRQRDRRASPPRPPTSASSRPRAWRCWRAPTTSPRPKRIAYGIVLQAVEVATALIMGLPALRQRGALLARGAPAHDARHAGQARAAAERARRRSRHRRRRRRADLAYESEALPQASRARGV